MADVSRKQDAKGLGLWVPYCQLYLQPGSCAQMRIWRDQSHQEDNDIKQNVLTRKRLWACVLGFTKTMTAQRLQSIKTAPADNTKADLQARIGFQKA